MLKSLIEISKNNLKIFLYIQKIVINFFLIFF